MEREAEIISHFPQAHLQYPAESLEFGRLENAWPYITQEWMRMTRTFMLKPTLSRIAFSYQIQRTGLWFKKLILQTSNFD